MTDRTAYQLIGFGTALIAVGLLNLAEHAWARARFRTQVAATAQAEPERFAELRSQLQSEEGISDDDAATPYD